MGSISEDQPDRRSWLVLLFAGLAAGLALRLYLAGFALTPGHGDSAFYYTVAKNIAAGRGPVVDYIVYFFGGLLPLPHYAGDFWNPVAAYLIAIPVWLLGPTIQHALLAGIVAGVVPAIAGFLAGRQFSGSLAVGVLTGLLTFFAPFEVWFSTTTEAIIFAGAFGSIALFLAMKGAQTSRFYLLAAIFSGLANLIRQDYVLLLFSLILAIILSSLTRKQKLTTAAATLAIHLVVLSPLLIANYTQLHTIFPSGPGKTAFLTTYEDFHSYGKEIDWQTLRATYGIQGILKRRLHTAAENLGQVEYFLDPVLGWLFLVALADLAILQRRWKSLRPLLPAVFFAILEYFFYTFVASFSGPGSLIKCLAALIPFIALVIVDFLWTRVRPSPLAVGLVVGLSIYCGYQGFQKNYRSTLYYNAVYQNYALVKTLIDGDAASQGLSGSAFTVMARDTWDVYEGTGYRTVMIPNNDLDTILFVARHYDTRYMLLPAPRKALEDIYMGTTPNPHFRFVAAIAGTDWKLFRVDPASP